MHFNLIDARGVAYRHQEGLVLKAGEFETQAIIGSLKQARSSKLFQGTDRVVFLWDGKTNFRYDLYPPYKAQRKANPQIVAMREALTKVMPYIKEGLYLLGVDQAYSDVAEADDIAGWLSSTLPEAGHTVTLTTGDSDWMQLVRQGVSLCNPSKSAYITHKAFEDHTGCPNPRFFLEHKALTGDGADNIKGVSKIGEKGATELLDRFGTVANFVKEYRSGSLDGEKLPKAWVSLALNEDSQLEPGTGRLKAFARNITLMNLRDSPKPERLVYKRGKYDRDRFKDFCLRFNFMSIVDDLDNFASPFI